MTGIENPSNPIILSVHHAIIMMDVKGQIAYWNKEAEELFGWTSEEVIGKNLHTLLMPEQYREDFTKGFDEFRLSGRGDVINKTIELTAKHRDGYEFPVEVSLGIVPIMDTWYAIGVVKDVARKKHLEFQLSHADKMESIGTLAAGIAHDFNNILSSIIGYTELAMDDTVEDTLIHSNLTEVITAANRARDLVRQLLKFSRQTETVPEPVHVKSVVIEAMKLIRASFPSTIDIRMNINSDGLVMASYTQLHQIILNLCTNAGHAMEEQGGILTVNLEDVVRDVLPAQHRRVTDGAYVKLSVSDTGMGMTTEILSKAFTPFFTTRKQGEGVGMGLPTVHGIVTTLNGWILPKSEPGIGSEFEVYLPVVGQDRRRRPKSQITSGDRGIILFVDDEEPILKLGKIVLEQHGYKVDTAARSREALELFRKTPEKYTLVITDLRMPVMTGEELARQIHLIRPETPIILCTGFDKSISEEMAIKSGFKAVVSKPILADEVTEAIGRVLGQVRQ